MPQPAAITSAPVTGRARKTLLKRLIDFVAMPASLVARQDRAMAGDILLEMLFHAGDDERLFCAKRLSQMRGAPRPVLIYLSQCKIEIAESVLAENEGLVASDICQIIDHISPAHRLVIAERKLVQGMVCDALARIGEKQVLLSLLSNSGAELTNHCIDLMVELSKEHTELCMPIVRRLETAPGQAMALFWWADGETRREILNRYAANRAEMVDLCADVFAMAAAEGWQDEVARKTLQLIERRQRNRAAIDQSEFDSLEHAIEDAARLGMSSAFAQEIGYLAGVKPVTIAKILSDQGGEGLAVLCKSTGLKRPYLRALWRSLKRPETDENGQEDQRLAYVVETYDMLTVAKAQTTLRYWNWSLSTTFTPRTELQDGSDGADELAFSAARRTARLVFGAGA